MALAGRRWGRFDVRLEGRSPLLPIVAAMMNRRSALTGICTGDQGMFVERSLFDEVGGFPPLPLMEDVALSGDPAREGGAAALRRAIASSSRGAAGMRAVRSGRSHRCGRLRFAYWRGADPARLARRYTGTDPAPRATLQVFAKPPLPGLVKTRLASAIGNEAAAAVYRDLVLRTLGVAAAARRAGVVRDVELLGRSGGTAGATRDLGRTTRIELRTQRGADLGERMRNALRTRSLRVTPRSSSEPTFPASTSRTSRARPPRCKRTMPSSAPRRMAGMS